MQYIASSSSFNPARLRKFGLSSFKQLLLRVTKKALTAYIYNDRNLGNRLQDGVPDTCHGKKKKRTQPKKNQIELTQTLNKTKMQKKKHNNALNFWHGLIGPVGDT